MIAPTRLLPLLGLAATSLCASESPLDATAAPSMEAVLAVDDACFSVDGAPCAVHALQAHSLRISAVEGRGPGPRGGALALEEWPHDWGEPVSGAAPAADASNESLAAGSATEPPSALEQHSPAVGRRLMEGVAAPILTALRWAEVPKLLSLQAVRTLGNRHETEAITLAVCSAVALMLAGAAIAIFAMRPKASRGAEAGRVARSARLTRQRVRSRELRAQRKKGQNVCC